jgi:hypothetical protein
LFRGLSAPLVGYSLECGINYSAFNQARQWFERNNPWSSVSGSGGGGSGISSDTSNARTTSSSGGGGGGGGGGGNSDDLTSTSGSRGGGFSDDNSGGGERTLTARLCEVAASGALGGFLLSAVVGPTVRSALFTSTLFCSQNTDR